MKNSKKRKSTTHSINLKSQNTNNISKGSTDLTINDSFKKYTYKIQNEKITGNLLNIFPKELPKEAHIVRLDSVQYRDNPDDQINKPCVQLNFIEMGENMLYRVHFSKGNKQYNKNNKIFYSRNPVKEQEANYWSNAFFKVDFNDLDRLMDIRNKKTRYYRFIVFHYEKFDSLYPVPVFNKVPSSLFDTTHQMTIEEIKHEKTKIRFIVSYQQSDKSELRFPINYSFSLKVANGSLLRDVRKFEKTKNHLSKILNLPFDEIVNSSTLIGRNVNVRVNKTANKVYCNLSH